MNSKRPASKTKTARSKKLPNLMASALFEGSFAKEQGILKKQPKKGKKR